MSERWNDPPRLLDASDDDLLREALRAGEAELATDAQMADVAAKLGPILDPGGGDGGAGSGGGAGPPAAGASGAGASVALPAKILTVLGASAIVVAGYWVTTTSTTTSRSTTTSTATTTSTSPAAMPQVESPSAPRIASPSAPRIASPSAPSTSTAPAPMASAAVHRAGSKAAIAEDEVSLLQRAQAALKANPREALTICNTHAKHYPSGLLAQEREVMAVDALMKLGREGEARVRAKRFKEAHPHSTHVGRIEVIVGESL